MQTERKNKTSGFTLLELLVVIGVIAILSSLLIPALKSARAKGRAVKSLSNLRQWGLGAIMFTNENQGILPYEGEKTDMKSNFEDDEWWANCIPQMVEKKSYREESADGEIPLPPKDNIFIDPSAKMNDQALKYGGYYLGNKKFYFCYVWNAELDNTLEIQFPYQKPCINIAWIRPASETLIMMEIRTHKDELQSTDPFYNEDLARHMGDWQRFTARHFGGGHMAFIDGHCKYVTNEFATTNSQGSRENPTNENMNKEGLIWDPFGPTCR